MSDKRKPLTPSPGNRALFFAAETKDLDLFYKIPKDSADPDLVDFFLSKINDPENRRFPRFDEVTRVFVMDYVVPQGYDRKAAIDDAVNDLIYNNFKESASRFSEHYRRGDRGKMINELAMTASYAGSIFTENDTRHTAASSFSDVMARHNAVRNGEIKLDRLPWEGLGLLYFEAGETVTFAARPEIGKSQIACILAHTYAKQGDKVLLISPEMDRVQVTRRLAGIHFGINHRAFALGTLTEEQEKLVNNYDIEGSYLSNVTVVDGEYGINISKVERYVRASKPDKIIIDAAHLVHNDLMKAFSKTERYENADAGQKIMAQNYGVPVLRTVQLNRESDNYKEDKKDKKTGKKTTKQIKGTSRAGTVFGSDSWYQSSSIFIGMELGEEEGAEYQSRVLKVLKTREGGRDEETGGKVHIRWGFDPVDFSEFTPEDDLENPMDEGEAW